MAFPLLIPLAIGAIRIGSGVARVGVKAAGAAISVAGSVAKAAGGLLGGGKSGNVMSKAGQSYAPNSPQGRMIVQAQQRQKRKEASKKGGMGLAKMKSSISGFSGSSSGAMTLPTMGEGEATPMTLLSRILGQITKNTDLLSSMLQVLATSAAPPPPPPVDTISNAQIEKGSNEGPGKVKQVFSALGTKVKSITSGLGGVGKFLLKGILGVGALVAFTKYRDNISGFISRTFEMLEGFGSRFANSDDPFGSFLDSLMSTGEGSILDSLKKGLAFVLEELVFALKLMLNELPFINFDLSDREASKALTNLSETDAADVNDSKVYSVGNSTVIDTPDSISQGANEGASRAVGKKVQNMFDAFQMSGGRVQWTNVGSGFDMGGPWSLTNMNPGITVGDIMSSQPIFDGKLITMDKLNSGLDFESGLKGLSKDVRKDVIQALSVKSNFEQMLQRGKTEYGGKFGGRFFSKSVTDGIIAIDKEILDLRSPSGDTASNGVSMPVVVADSSQHQTNTGDTFAMATSADPNDKTFNALINLTA